MKKINIHNICIGGGFLLLTLFTSCKSFLDGNTFLAELEKSMLYANAPYVDVTFTSKGTETATLIPAPGTYSDKYKASDTIQLQFEPQTGFFFSGWTVEPEDSVIFEDLTNSKTTVIIVSTAEPITITANTSQRPSIVSAFPSDPSVGVYRDRTIVVRFNKEMDSGSIYWTYSELKEKGVDPKNAFKVDENQPAEKALYYAYWDGSNVSSYTYKNIEIKKYADTSVNLLQYYGIPKFDESNARILRIPTKVLKQGEETIIMAPPSVTEILVTLKKDFFCKILSSEVSLSADKEWTYYTNGNTDNDPPVFITAEGEEKFRVSFTDNSKNNLTEDLNTLSTATDKQTFLGNYSKNRKLCIKGSFSDEGSGPNSLEWKLTEISSSLYSTSSSANKYEGMIKLNKTGDSTISMGKDGTELDLGDFKGEGLYRLDFIASDNNDRKATKSFYLFCDNVEPGAVSDLALQTEKTANGKKTITKYRNGKVYLQYKTPNAKDLDGIKIAYEPTSTDKTSPTETIRPKEGNTLYTSEEVKMYRRGKQYTFDVYLYDLAGNVCTAPASVNTDCYIKSNGNFVFMNNELDFTSMVPVLQNTKTIDTFPTNMKDFGGTESQDFDTVVSFRDTKDEVTPYSGAFSGKRGKSVTLDAYKLGKYEVTAKLYEDITGETLKKDNNNLPAMQIGYYHNISFCNRLSEIYGHESCYAINTKNPGKTKFENGYESRTFAPTSEDFWANLNDYTLINKNMNTFITLACNFSADGFRLPTELEWEFAARGGNPESTDWLCMYPGKTNEVYEYYYYDVASNSMKKTDAESKENFYYDPVSKNVMQKSSQGDDKVLGKLLVVDNDINHFAYWGKDYGQPVNQYESGANSLGLVGMCGNSSEWCWDRVDEENSTISSGLSVYGLDGCAKGTSFTPSDYNFPTGVDLEKVSYYTGSGDAWKKMHIVRTVGFWYHINDWSDLKLYSQYYTAFRWAYEANKNDNQSDNQFMDNLGMRLCQTITTTE